MKKFLATAVMSLGLMSCGPLYGITECGKFTALEDMQEEKHENVNEEKLLIEIRKLAIKIEDHIGLPHEPELVHARKYCEQLLIMSSDNPSVGVLYAVSS